MGLQAFLDSNPTLDLSNPHAVDQAFDQTLKVAEISQSQQPSADPIVEEIDGPISDEQIEIVQDPPVAVSPEAAPAADAPPAAAEPTEVEKLRAELAASKAKVTEYETKQQTEAAKAAADEAAKAGQDILNELIETYGEDSPIVKAHKFQMARDTPKAPAAAVDPANDPQAPAKHAAALEQTPFLRSIFDGADPEMLAFADIVSDKIMRDSAGTPDALPVSKEHYLAVEKRLLERFPQAKSQFYPTQSQRDALSKRGNVTTLRDLNGGSAPPTGTARQIGMKEVMAVMHEPQYKGMDIDQILATLVRAA